MNAPVRILIADDEAPARDRLRRLLVEIGDCECVGEAANGADARKHDNRARPRSTSSRTAKTQRASR